MANTPTTYYAINKPASGDIGWGTTMNADMDTIDTALQGMAQRAGRAGGQTLYGGTAANEKLTLEGTSHGTKTSAYILLNTSGAYVGIGTTTPGHGLQINGSGAAGDRNTGELCVLDTTAYAADVGGQILLGGKYTSAGAYNDAGAGIRAYKVNGTDGNWAFGLKLATRANAGNLTTKVTITDVGYVGVGTQSPTSPLHIYGAGAMSSGLYVQSNSQQAGVTFAINGYDGYSVYDNWGQLTLWNTTDSRADLVIQETGNIQVGAATKSVGIGVAPLAPLHVLTATAGTNAVNELVRLAYNSSGTPAAGFGLGTKYFLKSSTTADQFAAADDVLWAEATHASYKARRVFYMIDASGARECLRMEASGSAPMIGFLGAAATTRPTGVAVSAAGIHAALVTLGLIAA